MGKTFGKAVDFYRARVLTLEEEMPPDFYWREDILYRKPEEKGSSKIKTSYCLQIVELDSRKHQVLNEYTDKKEAHQALIKIQEDLAELTKMEFENKHDICITGNSTLTDPMESIDAGEKNDKTNVPRNLS